MKPAGERAWTHMVEPCGRHAAVFSLASHVHSSSCL
jgi:hypothetical protein